MGGDGLFFVLVLILLALWAFASGQRRRRKREEQEAAEQVQAFLEAEREAKRRNAIARALMAGGDGALFSIKFYGDPSMRQLQIAGESRQIVLKTKSQATRRSRLDLMNKCLAEVQSLGWPGFDGETKDFVVRSAVATEESAAIDTTIESVEKHTRAADRAIKPATRKRYLGLAISTLESAMEETVSDRVRAALMQAREGYQRLYESA